jgi:hypothetical protein
MPTTNLTDAVAASLRDGVRVLQASRSTFLGRDDSWWAQIMELRRPTGDAAARPIPPAAAANPARTVIDDGRSRSQLFARSRFGQAQMSGGSVAYDGIRSDRIAARFVNSTGRQARNTRAHRRPFTVLPFRASS